jgi:hypothetical protein
LHAQYLVTTQHGCLHPYSQAFSFSLISAPRFWIALCWKEEHVKLLACGESAERHLQRKAWQFAENTYMQVKLRRPKHGMGKNLGAAGRRVAAPRPLSIRPIIFRRMFQQLGNAREKGPKINIPALQQVLLTCEVSLIWPVK